LSSDRLPGKPLFLGSLQNAATRILVVYVVTLGRHKVLPEVAMAVSM
jgi:hypothetical protein